MARCRQLKRNYDEHEMCASCNGSGEGQYDGTTCPACGGTGTVYRATPEPCDPPDDDIDDDYIGPD